MGTSVSSNGPGSNVSLDPAWLDDIEIPGNDTKPESTENKDNIVVNPLAPKARFAAARRKLGDYVRSGNSESLRKSLGHYSKTGMGGSRNAANRMRATTKVAAGFVNTFRNLRDDPNFLLGKTISDLQLKGANATEIIKTIINAVCPDGGSIDEQLSRDSGTVALSTFLENNPDADISKLSDDQIWNLTGEYLGNEIFGRVQMDIGQSFERADISILERVNYMNEMRDYIKAEIFTQLNGIRQTATQQVNIDRMIQQTIQKTFAVFEMEVDA